MKNTQKLIVIAFVILLWLFGGTVNAETLHSSKPNMIFIMADDIGKNILSLPRIKNVIKIPNLERLAAEGVTFKNAYATHLCFSTRVKLVSGRASLNTGAYGNQFPDGGNPNRVVDKERTTGFYKYFYEGDSSIYPFIDPQYTPSFALPLKQAGYTTAVVGKWHLNDYIKQPHIFRTFGFDEWMISSSHVAPGALTNKGYVVTPNRSHAEKSADFVVNFITENKDKPFFVYYPMNLVHSPFVMPSNPVGHLTHTLVERQIAMIEYVDQIIGRLIKTLETLNIKNRTIIFFSGDNGDAGAYRSLYELIQGPEKSKAQPFRGKGSLYEGGVNVPLIVSGGPVVKRGKTEALVDFTDILPTLADLAGISVVRKNRKNNDDYRGINDQYVSVAGLYKGDGYSIAPFLSGQSDDTPRNWMMFASKGDIVVRNKEFKLWAKIKDNTYQGYKLYDLYNDPYEQTNLYDSTDQTILTAKQRIENILDGVPEPTRIDEYFDPVDWNYGMLSHWTFNQPKFLTDKNKLTDTEGGYNAYDTEIIFDEQGKFGQAISADRLQISYSEGLFYNFILGDNERLFNRHGKGIFYKGITKLIETNKTLMEFSNSLYTKWSPPNEYPSIRGDREKFLSGMTVSAWIQTPQPTQDIYILKQPYADKEGNLISFSITEDATVNFELTTNDETAKLESKTLDRTLWGQWMHIVATWDGRSECGETILYVNGARVARACLGRPLSADDTDNLLLGGFAEDLKTNHAETLIDDIALWRQPLMPMQIEALYRLGNRFSYDASQVDALFNTAEEDGTTKIGDRVWHRTALEKTTDTERLMILDLRDEVKVQFGDVMAVRLKI